MAENERCLITIPKRGLKIIPPNETTQKMEMARSGQRTGKWSAEEKLRLRLLINCSILKNRYPSVSDGQQFMQNVDYNRREELLNYAIEMAENISDSWCEISFKPIAILVYGSVTRGLVKSCSHPDPSNIDMSVIGDINEEERNSLFDLIRPKRMELKARILSSCGNYDLTSEGGNAGVVIQHFSKLTKNNYCAALEYVAANALALRDDQSIWSNLEKEALEVYNNNLNSKRQRSH